MRVVPVFLLMIISAFVVLAEPARAHEESSRCVMVLDLMWHAAEPRVATVAPVSHPVHFLKNNGWRSQPGCPNTTAACRLRAFVVPGDDVIVTRIAGDYACATYTSPAPPFRVTDGWLPRKALKDGGVTTPKLGAWNGVWWSDDEQKVNITLVPEGNIKVEGEATWGAFDAERRASGAIHTGEIEAIVRPEGSTAAFVDEAGGVTQVHDASPDNKFLCRVRLWRLGPYLVAVNCGGINVSFTGVYRRAKGAR
jgi:hypothetical protein